MAEKKSVDISYVDILPVIKEQLSLGGTARIKPYGTSMLPLIHQGRDSVVLEKFNGNAKKYDILFYRRNDGQFVLHRLVKFDKNGGYVIRGDHQIEYEYGITDKNVIGVVKSITRNNKVINRGSKAFILWAVFGSAYSRLIAYPYVIKNKLEKLIK